MLPMRRHVRSCAVCGRHRDPGVYRSNDLHRYVQLILKVNAEHIIGYLLVRGFFPLLKHTHLVGSY